MIDWDDAFYISGYVPGAEALIAGWADKAAAMRASLVARGRTKLDQSYGPGPREVYDVFSPETTQKGTVIFVHGGYWHRLNKSSGSHFAKGCLDNGWAVAMPSYPLAPEARISQITDAIRAAVTKIASTTDGPISLVGHSAGGHLVTRMACAGVLPTEITNRISRVTSVSGVHHLSPLVGTKMNDTLKLTETEAEAESPVLLDPVATIPVTFWVGDRERPEFLRQTRMAAERWEAKSPNVRSFYEPGIHHFNILDSLASKDSALTQEVLR